MNIPGEDMVNQSTLNEKEQRLREQLRDLGSILVAYSGGVDSSFLAKVASEELAEYALAVTAASEAFPKWERDEACALAKEHGIRHRLLETSELAIPGFRENPHDRCYYCKSELFSSLGKLAESEGISYVADGTTADDAADYRPGWKAAREHRVISPLYDNNLHKEEIRELSQSKGLPTWNKATFACLASRIPYGEEITAEKLQAVEKAEDVLRARNFRQYRVRHHGNLARIEVLAEDIPRLATEVRSEIVTEVKNLGFQYVTLDLSGYREGSMNETLSGT